MMIKLKDKTTKPPFNFFVKENTGDFDYYIFDNVEDAMNKARILSLTNFPISIILEPFQNKYGEWKMKRTFVYCKGKCKIDDEELLHCKFYTDAGNCLNKED